MADKRKSYPSDVSDAEWAFCLRYLTLMSEEAPQRGYPLRELFDALRWFVRAGCPWRMMPHDLPPWSAVYQQTQRWIKAGSFEAMVHDLRAILRLVQDRKADPSAVIVDIRPSFEPIAHSREPSAGSVPPRRMIVRRPTGVAGARNPVWLRGVLRLPNKFPLWLLPRRVHCRYSLDRQRPVPLFPPPLPVPTWPSPRSGLGPVHWLE